MPTRIPVTRFPLPPTNPWDESREPFPQGAARQPVVGVHIDSDDAQFAIRIQCAIDGSLQQEMIPRDAFVERLEIIRDLARQFAHRHAQQFERQIEAAILDAVQRGRAHEYRGRSFGMDTLQHARDLMNAHLVPRNDLPAGTWKTTEFKHKLIEHTGWKATLLETAEQIRAEGEEMSHCLGKSYLHEILSGTYAAFHISAPESTKFPKSGFTLGFKNRNGGWRFDQVKGKKNDTHYCKDPLLLEFIEVVDKKINNLPADVSTKTFSRGDMAWNAISPPRVATQNRVVTLNTI